MVFKGIKKIFRWIKFHLIYKRRFSRTPGKPCLCSNIKHKFHESLWEKKNCELLCETFGDRNVYIPSQHKYPVKFDFIVNGIAIFEPHAIYSTNPENNSYLTYYKQRRQKADQYKELKCLPLIVISNSRDFSKLKETLITNPTKRDLYLLSEDLLKINYYEMYDNDQKEPIYMNNGFSIPIIGYLGWIIAFLLIIYNFL